MYHQIAKLIRLQGETTFTCKELHSLFPNNKSHGDIVRHLKRRHGIDHQAIIVRGKAVGYIFDRGFKGNYYNTLKYYIKVTKNIGRLQEIIGDLRLSNKLLGFGLCYAIGTLIGLVIYPIIVGRLGR